MIGAGISGTMPFGSAGMGGHMNPIRDCAPHMAGIKKSDMPMYYNNMPEMMAMKSIDSLYPPCHNMLNEAIHKECRKFMMKSNGMMPASMTKEVFLIMVENITINIMSNEAELLSKLNEGMMDQREKLEEEDSTDRGYFGTHGGLLVRSIIAIMLLNELKRRGCRYCHY